MTVIARVNGRVQAYLPITDRGLHYGDGVFETIAVLDGAAPWWPRHYERLRASCERLGIPVVDPALVQEDVAALSRDCARAVIKLIVTRGEGGRGYRPPLPAEQVPSRIALRYPWPDYPRRCWEDGVAVRVCNTRLSSNPALAGIKHLNRLEHVLARSEWYDPDVAEGLMMDSAGNVVEGTQTNLFVARGRRLLTPPVNDCGVAGVMREIILEQVEAWSGVRAEESVLRLEHVREADEILLCNAVIGIWPVSRIEDRLLPIGPATRQLMKGLRALQDAWTKGGQRRAHDTI